MHAAPVFPTLHPRLCILASTPPTPIPTPAPPPGRSIIGELRVDDPTLSVAHPRPHTRQRDEHRGPPVGATLASGDLPSPQRGGVMGGVPGGGTPSAAEDSGSVVSLLTQTQANPRSTHMFLHVSVDLPLPRPSDDADRGVGGDTSNLTVIPWDSTASAARPTRSSAETVGDRDALTTVLSHASSALSHVACEGQVAQ